MGAAYSHDLRMRVIAAIDGGMSKMAVHRTFRVSRSTIDDWLTLRVQQGQVRPKVPVRRGPLPASADLEAFADFAQRHSRCTLEQMARAWEQETGRRLSRNTFSLALKKIDWTRKKRVSCMPSAIQHNAPSSSSS